MTSRTLWALSTFSLLTACVGSPSKDKEKEKASVAAEPHDAKKAAERLKEFILDAAPSDMGTKLDINLDNNLTILGSTIEAPVPAKAGDKVKITTYWAAQRKLDPGWKLFTHIMDGAGQRVINIDNVGPLREMRDGSQSLPPGDWEVGKVYVDEQVFKIPNKANTDTLQIMTGVWRSHERMKVLSGPHDTANRAIIGSVSLNGKAGTRGGHIPTLRVDKLEPSVKIKLDGKLDEAAWATAPTTGPLVDAGTGQASKGPVNGDVKVLWNDEGIYVGFSVADTNIIGGFTKTDKDPQLWTKDTVEMMVDPEGDGDNKDYYEIQINPQNLVFDSQFDDYNQPKVEPNGPFGHQEWSANLKSAVTVDGTVDKTDDEDRGYTVEAFIPWKSFNKAKKLPPELGSSWRVNFYAMKNNGGVAWSPILGQGNFHRAPRFGRITWNKKGAPDAAASAAPATSGAPAASGAPSGSASAAVKAAAAPAASVAIPR